MKLFKICFFSFLFTSCFASITFSIETKTEQKVANNVKIEKVSNKQTQQQLNKNPNVEQKKIENNNDKNIIKNDIEKNKQVNKTNINDEKAKNNALNSTKVDEKLFHIVREGDNIYRISLMYGITQKDLMEVNKLANSNVRIGQKLFLPKGVVKKVDDLDNNNKDNQGSNNVINENLSKVENTKNVINKTDFVSKINSTTFIWPVRGNILTHFGHITNGGKLEGVNIGCEKGANVKASASGEVVFNNYIEGYGNVILIKHYNGFFTAYGYTESLITEGDKIKKGQVIAYVKNKEGSNRAILYFSIRKNHKSYDPEKIIQVKINN